MPLFKRENISWGVLAIEMVAIMLSVVLGFALNEWRVNRAEADAVESAKQSLIRELETNNRVNEQRLAYYAEFRDTLSVLMDSHGPDAALAPDTLGFASIFPYFFTSGAYEAARASGTLSNMDFDTIELLSVAYTLQDTYADMSMKVADWQRQGHLRTVRDHLEWIEPLAHQELTAHQEAAILVLQGRPLSEVVEEIEGRYEDL